MTTPSGTPPALFAGPGEVRAILRSLPWSDNPLGPVESWSPVLRTMVRGALASSFPIIIHWGPDRVALYNDAMIAVLGGKHPAALGRPAVETWSEAWDLVGGRLDEVVQQGHTLQAVDEQRVLYRNGYPEECYFSYSHSPIEDIDGRPAGVLSIATETTAKVLYQRRMGVVQDLGGLSSTDAGSAEETCRAVLRVLETARETMPFALAALREDGGPLRLVAEYGLAPDRPRERGGPADSVAALFERVLATGRPEEITGLRADYPGALLPGPLGPLLPDATVLLPLTVSGRSAPIGVLAIGVNPYRPLNAEYRAYFRLIARQVRVALGDSVAYEVERLRGQVLADLDRAKMEFFQNVSHELRTPLTVLLAPLHDLVSSSGDRPAAEQEDLHAALRAAERLNAMADALLDFTGAEARTLRPNRQPTDVAELTAQTASMFRSAAEHAGLDFRVQLPTARLTASVDRAMWSTIVSNLVSNAVKYTRRGSVRVELRAAETNAVLVVADTGLGIAPAQQPLVFHRFHRVAGTGERGAGIGLSVVADLVRAHEGHLDLASTPGRGSTFTVTVPLLTGAPEATPDVVAPGAPPTAESGAPWVVVVEDDLDLRDFLGRLLTREGWRVTSCPDAESALDLLVGAAEAPSLILTDVMLPGQDGLGLISRLRQEPATSRTPIIVLTARQGAEATAEGMAAGADDYITKPFSTQELLARAQANYRLAEQREQEVKRARADNENLRTGLETSRTIGTAIGILMTTHRLSAPVAFRLLAAASQHTNRKLRDVAADVAAGGRLPLRPTLVDELLIRVSAAST